MVINLMVYKKIIKIIATDFSQDVEKVKMMLEIFCNFYLFRCYSKLTPQKGGKIWRNIFSEKGMLSLEED